MSLAAIIGILLNLFLPEDKEEDEVTIAKQEGDSKFTELFNKIKKEKITK